MCSGPTEGIRPLKISELFRQDIARRIEEVVKVDVADEAIVAEELSEYVVTERILDSLQLVVEAYQETILNPSGITNLWVSGFFGSGKSSFAKVLGYILENRVVAGKPASEWFFAHCDDLKLKALLNTCLTQAPACTVLLDLASSHDVLNEAEGIVAPVYRALLARFSYAQTPKLASLEFDLETEGKLAEFQAVFSSTTGRSWESSRDNVLAVNLASKSLHALDPGTFPAPDSWARSFEAPVLNAKWFASRAEALLDRRGAGAKRIIFVVDEVGQYASRSIPRIFAMQGLAEEFQKRQGKLWLIATSQERLDAVVEGLEGRLVEVQRLRDRFPLRVDLLPSDIHEVVSRRILDKNDQGRKSIAASLASHRERLTSNTRLVSETRAADPGEEELIDMYPLVPYQVQLLIDAVSTRRNQVMSSAPMGGSNRTIIKHAQQLITSAKVGLGQLEVGVLATLDRSYDLLEEVIPTGWRAEVDQVAAKYGATSAEVRTMKTIALVHDVRSLNLTAHNIAVLLHPAIGAESQVPEITGALAHLVSDDRLREDGQRGYQLQSAEQKQWAQERKNIDLSLGDEVRLRKRLLEKVLSGLTVVDRRTFKIGISVDKEQLRDGDIALELVATLDTEQRESLRQTSREGAHMERIFWAFSQGEEAWHALRELHRSERMIDRHNVASKSTAEVGLIADESNQRTRYEKLALDRLADNLKKGEIFFRGRSESIPSQADPRAAAQALVRERIPEIFPNLASFAATVDVKTVALVLRADDLASLPDALGESGIGLTQVTPGGTVLVTDSDPLAAFVAEVRRRNDYGQVPTGGALERHFASAPNGAPVEVVQVLTAAALRAGLVELVHQGQRIGSASDRRLDNVFRTLPGFRQAEVRPPQDLGPDPSVRTRLASKLQEQTGEQQSPSLEELARNVRRFVEGSAEAATEVAATLTGAGLAIPSSVSRLKGLIARIRAGDDAEVVVSAAGAWEDLVEGVKQAGALRKKLNEDLASLTAARIEAGASDGSLTDSVRESRDRLRDLLATADYVGHSAEIRSLSETLASARRLKAAELAHELNQKVKDETEALEELFRSVDDVRREQALKPLKDLKSSPDGSAEALQVQMTEVGVQAELARRLLEELASERTLVDLRVSNLINRPVLTPGDLEELLAMLRNAVENAWKDGQGVRLT